MTTLTQLIIEILHRTPVFVWFILAGLIALGVRQMSGRAMSRRRLLIAPIALGLYSLYGASSLFGAHADVITAWATAWVAMLAASTWGRAPSHAGVDAAGRVLVPGSVWPLLTMLTVFALRYVTTVSLAIHPELARDAMFDLSMAAAYGALSGVFAARAVRLLRVAPTAAHDRALPSIAA